MLSDYEEPRSPERMAAALRDLPSQPRPTEEVILGLLDGFNQIRKRLADLFRPSDGNLEDCNACATLT